MKRSYKTMMGVTLLEIMLVLAIAALVIVMSIRFYQSASDTNKVNAAMSTIQGIVAAGENAVSGGTGVDGSTMATTIVNYLPGGEFPPGPWGGRATVTTGSGTSYTITMPSPGAAGDVSTPCGKLEALLKQNTKFTGTACSGGNIAVVVQM